MSFAEIAGYRIVRQLGAGGMGQVFLVQHPRLPRQDALKLLDAGVSRNDDFKVRFQREADLLAQLSHPNIVTLHDRGEFEDRLWITMEYVAGTDAGELVKVGGALDPTLGLELVAGAGAALDYAWRKQRITHRDVKPANILLGVDGGELEVVKLADFGIAKAAGESTSLTSTGITVGTMQYISPEAIEGEDLDNRADIYSLGCTAFHLLTGRPPYTGKSITALMSAHLTQAPPSVREVAPQLPDGLDTVFAKVLAKAPEDRYQSSGEFVAALRGALDGQLDDSLAIAVPVVPSRQTAPDVVTELRAEPGPAGDAGATHLRAAAAERATRSRAVPILAAVVAVLAVAATVLGVAVSRSGGAEEPAAVTSSTTTNVPPAPVIRPSSASAPSPVSVSTPAPIPTVTARPTTAATLAPTMTTSVNKNVPGSSSPQIEGSYCYPSEYGKVSDDGKLVCVPLGEGFWRDRTNESRPAVRYGSPCTEPGARARIAGTDELTTCILNTGGVLTWGGQ
ncbi:serine/threonine protein kinase [Tsukamurella asaccharolytica]|uniref:non-specific serine/threonine protein kinase n=1 Tax=Tsukamurella asaccharolytica TaxID=2592067 RepID=A0A5C5R7D4_9ACTN|nr:serine/threonine-protein kinase [Tsukamurella asaccharolytica]TWS18586.1 serine/threonine protein kinase [Tsukamurella asaccharolytica]